MAIGRPLNLTANVATKNISVVATAEQTSFTVAGGYIINEIGVYRNGTRLVDGRDFTATDGAIVTLLSAATVGDVLEFAVFDAFNIADAVNTSGDSTINGNLTATSFIGDGSNLTGIDATAVQTGTTKVQTSTPGISNEVGGLGIGTFSGTGLNVTGVVTATSFVGSGANLTGIDATVINTGTTKVQTSTPGISNEVGGLGIGTFSGAGLNVTGIVTATSFVGAAVTTDSQGIRVAGVVTATSFVGAVTIADDAVETAMIADDAVTADKLSVAYAPLASPALTGSPTLARATIGSNTATGFYSLNAITNTSAGNGWSAIYAQNKTSGGRVFAVPNAGGTAETITMYEDGSATFAGEVTFTDNLQVADTIWHHGDDDTNIRFPSANTFTVTTAGTQRMKIDQYGEVCFNATTWDKDSQGIGLGSGGWFYAVRTGGQSGTFGRNSNDGTIVDFRQDGTAEGSISVSGTTVSFNGGHLSRWSQLANGAERTEILRGSVLSNLDEMCEWAYPAQDAVLYTDEDELPEGVSVGDVKTPAKDAGTEDNEQLNRMQVSNIEGDKNVSGVFQSWDDDDDTYINDFYCAMTGDFVIRIAQGTTVARGDLLMSAGDGTAKPQDDDIIRSKTIAKVTSTNVSETYADNSYCVPCVLMAC